MASDNDVAFPVLATKDVAALEARGRIRPIRAGEVLFAEGDRKFCFFVVREGSIEILDNSRDTPRVIAVHRPGHFTGDVDMLTGRVALATGHAAEDREVRTLSAAELRRTLLLDQGFEGVKIMAVSLVHAHIARRA